jgi:hypothetical protein
MLDMTSNTWEMEPRFLKSDRLTDRIHLGQTESVTFHWADFSEACGLWQSRLNRELPLRADYDQRVREIEKLRSLPVWVRKEKKVTQTNLYELYDGFIREKSWCGQGLLPHTLQEVSFVSPSGPFKSLPVTDCFNLATYQDFVFILLLQNKLPWRTFRLRVRSRLLAEYGFGLSDAGMVSLEQVSSEGLLLRVNSEMFFAGMNSHGRVRFLFNSRPLQAALQASSFERGIDSWGTNPFFTHDKHQSFELDSAQLCVSEAMAAPTSQGAESFLFVRFSHIELDNPTLAAELRAFIGLGESVVKRLLGTIRAA